MRPIYFRAKRIDNNEWVYGSLKQGCMGTVIIEEVDVAPTYSDPGGSVEVLYHQVKSDTVGQYWRTVNNQELFEGDIFSVNGKYNKIVRWVEKHAAFCVANISELNYDWMDIWQQPDWKWFDEFKREIVIIGNEFDNPELLKV